MGMKSGVLLLNKPTGPSSARALYPVKRAFPGSKVGHTGTLDPFASGLLVILVGHATRLSRWFMKLDKAYRAVVRFGSVTDTLDSEGTIVSRCDPPSRQAIDSAIPNFFGEIMQVPPAFSALKIGGRRAYELARSGSAVEPEARTVVVHEIILGDQLAGGEGTVDFPLDVRCGSGTYVRSLARDLGIAAGSCASLVELQRVVVGPFHLDEAAPAHDLEQGLIPVADAVERLGFATVGRIEGSDVAARLRNGGQIDGKELQDIAPETGHRYLLIDGSGQEVAIGVNDGTRFSYEAVFPERDIR